MNIGEIAVLSEELERLKEENATLRQKLGDAEGREGCRTIRLDECGHIIREPAPAQTEGEPVLHPATCALVHSFSNALAAKLLKSQEKYGHGASWQNLGDSWSMEDCQKELVRHVGKGDPLDVAAYCAFLWSKGMPTSAQTEGREDFDTWWDSPKRPAMRSSMTKEECRSVWEIANGTTPTDKPQEGAQA